MCTKKILKALKMAIKFEFLKHGLVRYQAGWSPATLILHGKEYFIIKSFHIAARWQVGRSNPATSDHHF